MESEPHAIEEVPRANAEARLQLSDSLRVTLTAVLRLARKQVVLDSDAWEQDL